MKKLVLNADADRAMTEILSKVQQVKYRCGGSVDRGGGKYPPPHSRVYSDPKIYKKSLRFCKGHRNGHLFQTRGFISQMALTRPEVWG